MTCSKSTPFNHPKHKRKCVGSRNCALFGGGCIGSLLAVVEIGGGVVCLSSFPFLSDLLLSLSLSLFFLPHPPHSFRFSVSHSLSYYPLLHFLFGALLLLRALSFYSANHDNTSLSLTSLSDRFAHCNLFVATQSFNFRGFTDLETKRLLFRFESYRDISNFSNQQSVITLVGLGPNTFIHSINQSNTLISTIRFQ